MKNKGLTRLEFITTSVRWTLGAALAALVFWLWHDERLTAACEQPCSTCAVERLCVYKREQEEERR